MRDASLRDPIAARLELASRFTEFIMTGNDGCPRDSPGSISGESHIDAHERQPVDSNRIVTCTPSGGCLIGAAVHAPTLGTACIT